MHPQVEELFMPVGPITGKVFVVPVTSTSSHIDLTAAAYLALQTAINGGCLVEITGDDDVFYRWSTSKGTGGAEPTEVANEAVTGASGTQADMVPRLFQGERKVERPGLIDANNEVKGIVVKSVVAATILRITICSRSAAQRMSLNG